MALDNSILLDTSDIVFYGTSTYPNALAALSKVWGKSEQATEMLLNAKYGAMDYTAAVQALEDSGVVAGVNANGYRAFGYTNNAVANIPSLANAVDSTASTNAVVQATPVINTAVDSQTGKVSSSLLTKLIGGKTWQYYAVSAGQALAATSVGISLGKTIDATLYNANPDFWDKHNMQSLNPETWSEITNGDDSFAATMFNLILGIEPDSGNAQLMIDQNAYAYLAQYMASMGVFDPTTNVYNASDYMTEHPTEMYGFSSNFVQYGNRIENYIYRRDTGRFYNHVVKESNGSNSFVFMHSNGDCVVVFYDYQPFTLIAKYYNESGSQTGTDTYDSFHDVFDNEDIYYINEWIGNNTNPTYETIRINDPRQFDYVVRDSSFKPSYDQRAIILVTKNVTPTASGGIDGIGNQTGATLPDSTGWNDTASTLASLQNQYPNLWDGAVNNTVVQPDGSVKTITYIPVPIPDTTGQYDTEPTTGTQTQADTIVQPSTDADTVNLLKTIIQLLVQPEPNPDIDTETKPKPVPPTPNPDDTGDGDSPTPIPTDGEATALWSVYHPTAAQIDSFGAWLWTDNVIQQFIQLLNNPMEGIITLHKVFITPTDASNSTIVVGRLDSNVPSATVENQYEYLDCGSVNLSEYFGNVFDYSPYTNISLYLPFIGFVTLNPDDVMRSTINIVYGVDLFTGACLATVNVTRDNYTVAMYQFTGVASVEYPLTGAQHSGLVNGLLGIGGGIAGIALASTGAGVVAGGTALLSGMANASKSNPARSGSFSGNAGAMGCKKPYIVIERPITKIADFSQIRGYPTNITKKLSDFSGNVVVQDVHVEGIPATDVELTQIDELLHSGVLV